MNGFTNVAAVVAESATTAIATTAAASASRRSGRRGSANSHAASAAGRPRPTSSVGTGTLHINGTAMNAPTAAPARSAAYTRPARRA